MFFWTLKAGHHWSVSEFPKYNYYRRLISIIVVWQSNCVKAWTLICVQHWGGRVFPWVLWHCWFGNRKGIGPVKELGVGGDILTGALQRLIAYININSITLSSNEIQMETFWYWLTQVHLDNGRWNGDREIGVRADDLCPGLGVLAHCAGGRCGRGSPPLVTGARGYYNMENSDILLF